jgi:ribosomal protein S18 acetylase RimI-like enzyme
MDVWVGSKVRRMNMVEPILRDATPEDVDFLYELHRAALKKYIELTWGWDEEWQVEHFLSNFDVSWKRIIQVDGEDIGCLAVVDEGDAIFLSYIALMPGQQGRGIGTRLIKTVLHQAGERGVPVRLTVLKPNPARRLYERLGFTVYKTTETHYLMIADPRAYEG